MSVKKGSISRGLLWILEGIIVGFGAIMPGISGGTLCVAFGMYLPIISLLSHPKENIKKYWKMLGLFAIGGVIGFVGLADLASWLLDMNSNLVICAFIGFIIGTLPELWNDAGKEGRRKSSFVSMVLGFMVIFTLLSYLKNNSFINIEPGIWGFGFSGILWGLSFIVPGLSSSSLLLFFGLYQTMLDGIGSFNLLVIIPVAMGMLACVVILSGWINYIYKHFYTYTSHFIIGVVVATVVMILPEDIVGMYQILCIVGGAMVSYILTRICRKLKIEKS